MEQSNDRGDETETFDSYTRKVQDQELKGILLKLKNEMRKPDASWETVKTILNSLLERDKKTFMEIISLIIRDS